MEVNFVINLMLVLITVFVLVLTNAFAMKIGLVKAAISHYVNLVAMEMVNVLV